MLHNLPQQPKAADSKPAMTRNSRQEIWDLAVKKIDTVNSNVYSLFIFPLSFGCLLYVQVNSNPCLEFACPILESMIVTVIDDTLSLALDPVFRPPAKHRKKTTEAAASAGNY